MLRILPWGEQSVSTYLGGLDPIQGWYAPEFGLNQANHVWGFNYSGKLPTWMGYVIWPELTMPTVEASSISGDSCRVAVRTADESFDLQFLPHDVFLERG